MHIRSFSPPDLSSVLEIYALAKLDELANEAHVPALIPLDLDQRRYAAFRSSTVYVCEGSALLGYGARNGPEITALFVHPAGRGQGVGRAILEHLLANFSGPSHLHVVASNDVAVSLYRQYGFELFETYTASYNSQPVVAAIMRQQSGAPTCTAMAGELTPQPQHSS
jgi:putative acetyltransferase